MIVVFTDLPAERAGALFTDVLGSSRDASYEGDGIIFSPFCDGSEGTAVYDSRFRPFHLPVAFLFVRHTVLSDWTFFVDDDALLDRWARRFGPAGTAALAQSSAACPGAWRVSNSPGACGVISAGNPELRQAGWRPSRCDAKPRSESVAAARHIERRRSRALLLRTEAVGKRGSVRGGREPLFMGARFIGVDREQVFLMPPSVRDWCRTGTWCGRCLMPSASWTCRRFMPPIAPMVMGGLRMSRR
jgi:hypothetical protein